jgi:endonuclease-3
VTREALTAAVEDACRLLRPEFGPVAARMRGRPLDELVATILSQSTTDVNSGRAFRALRRRFPSWDAVLAAPVAGVRDAIRGGGLANVKAPVIQRALRIIREREGRLSLRRLSRMSDAEAIDYLTSIPGVGIKTACCVLIFAMGRTAFPVDTHVYRVTRRLGWLPPGVPIHRASAALQPAIPGDLSLPLHLYLVWHGRRTCRARNPACGRCAIRPLCRTGRRRAPPRRAAPAPGNSPRPARPGARRPTLASRRSNAATGAARRREGRSS